MAKARLKTKGSGRKGAQFWKQPAEQVPAPPPDSSYWRKTCDICGAKAIYRWGRKAVCRAHKAELEADMVKDAFRVIKGRG